MVIYYRFNEAPKGIDGGIGLSAADMANDQLVNSYKFCWAWK